MKKPYIILFDGVCNLCNYSVKTIIKNDKKERFKFAELQSEVGKKLASSTGKNLLNLTTLILIDQEKVYTKSTAALKIASKMNFPWPVFTVFLLIPKPIRDWCYNLIAKNRYRIFGKQETCWVPNEKLKSRFIV